MSNKPQDQSSNPPERVTLANPFAATFSSPSLPAQQQQAKKAAPISMLNEAAPAHVAVSTDAFVDECRCSICYNPFTQCVITQCGHNFCNICITQWLKQKHSCPMCKASVTPDKLIRNYAMDRIILLFEEASGKEQIKQKQNEILSSLLQDAQIKANAEQQAEQDAQNLKFFNETKQHLESFFRNSIEQSLFKFQAKHKELFSEFQKLKTHVRQHYSNLINQKLLHPVNDGSDQQQTIRKLQFESTSECNKIFAQYQDKVKELLQSYENFVMASDSKFDKVEIKVIAPKLDSSTVMSNSLFQSAHLAQQQQQQQQVVKMDASNVTLVVGSSSADNLAKCCFTVTYNRNGNDTTSYYMCSDCKINCKC